MKSIGRSMILGGAAALAAACGGDAPAPTSTPVAVRTPDVEAAKAMPARTIHFPAEFNIGEYSFRPSSFVGGWAGSWQEMGKAQGDVQVPADTYVRLTGTRTAKSLDSIAKLQPDDLQCLELGSPNLTDETIAPLEKMTGLRYLSLPTGITDAGVAHVKGLPDLTDLTLSGSGITDAVFAQLKGAPKLKRVYYEKTTSVTKEGIDAALKENPKLKIMPAGGKFELPKGLNMGDLGSGGGLPGGLGGKKKE